MEVEQEPPVKTKKGKKCSGTKKKNFSIMIVHTLISEPMSMLSYVAEEIL